MLLILFKVVIHKVILNPKFLITVLVVDTKENNVLIISEILLNNEILSIYIYIYKKHITFIKNYIIKN